MDATLGRARACAARDDEGWASRSDRMAGQIEAARRWARVPGVAVVVVRGDEVVFLRGFGRRDAANDLPVTPDTVFGIGSCTKAFTALTAVLVADRGLLPFDDPPRRFLPYFRLADPAADAQVTVRDLLAHRPGLKAYDDEMCVTATTDSAGRR